MGSQRAGHDWETFTFTTHRYSHRPGALSRLPRADRTARWHSLFTRTQPARLHLSEDPTALRTSKHGSQCAAHRPQLPPLLQPRHWCQSAPGSDWGRQSRLPGAHVLREPSENTQSAPSHTLQDTPRRRASSSSESLRSCSPETLHRYHFSLYLPPSKFQSMVRKRRDLDSVTGCIGYFLLPVLSPPGVSPTLRQ